jgi:DNA-binding transcriptional LysR family regulator
VVRSWAVAGLGLMLRSEWDVAEHLAAGRLVRVLDRWTAPEAPVVALLGPRAGRAIRTQRFLETLRSALAPTPWRQRPCDKSRQ